MSTSALWKLLSRVGGSSLAVHERTVSLVEVLSTEQDGAMQATFSPTKEVVVLRKGCGNFAVQSAVAVMGDEAVKLQTVPGLSSSESVGSGNFFNKLGTVVAVDIEEKGDVLEEQKEESELAEEEVRAVGLVERRWSIILRILSDTTGSDERKTFSSLFGTMNPLRFGCVITGIRCKLLNTFTACDGRRKTTSKILSAGFGEVAESLGEADDVTLSPGLLDCISSTDGRGRDNKHETTPPPPTRLSHNSRMCAAPQKKGAPRIKIVLLATQIVPVLKSR